MDNRVFNVNGHKDNVLLKTLELAFMQEWGNEDKTATYWTESKEHGLILAWYNDYDMQKLPAPLTAEESFPIVKKWLDSDFAKTVQLSEWCGDMDHDGHNSMGFQVYVGDWGHVGNHRGVVCAVKPAYMWMGK